MRILGLDISTTTIGIAVIDINKTKTTLKALEYYKPPKNGDIFERLDITKKYIVSIIKKYKPDNVVIEDIILYMRRRSSANTIYLLTIFNRAIGLAVYETLGKSPILKSVLDIRDSLIIKEPLNKEDMPEVVAHWLKIPFKYELNKKGTKRVENYDMADALAAALSFNREKVERPKVLKKTKRRVLKIHKARKIKTV